MHDLHQPDPLLRVVDLDQHATEYLFLHSPGRRSKAYGLLHRNGSLIMKDESQPEIVHSWEKAVQLAEQLGQSMVVLFHEKSVRHRRLTPSGGYTWGDVVLFPHECARSFPSYMPQTEKEPDAHGHSKTAVRKARERASAQQKAAARSRRR